MRKLLMYRRFIAFTYDIIFQMIMVLVIILGITYINNSYLDLNQFNLSLLIFGVGLIIYILFFAILPMKLKGTIGKYLTEIQVIATNGRLTIGRWFFRELVFKYLYIYVSIGLTLYFSKITYIYLLIFIFFGLIVSIIFIIAKRMTMHNYYMKTVVVKKEDTIEH